MLKYRSIPVAALPPILEAVVGLTALRMRSTPHLSVEEFAPDLLSKLLDVFVCEEAVPTADGGTLEQLIERVRASLRENNRRWAAMPDWSCPSASFPVSGEGGGSGQPTQEAGGMEKVTCKREGDEVVVRIPAALQRTMLVLLEGVPGLYQGWSVRSGAIGESDPVDLRPLSASHVRSVFRPADSAHSQARAASPGSSSSAGDPRPEA